MICVLGAKFNRRYNEIKFRSSATTQQKVNLLLQKPPNLPQTASNLPQTCLKLAPNLLQTASNLPQTASNSPQTASNLPRMAPNLPRMASNLPQKFSNRALTLRYRHTTNFEGKILTKPTEISNASTLDKFLGSLRWSKTKIAWYRCKLGSRGSFCRRARKKETDR